MHFVSSGCPRRDKVVQAIEIENKVTSLADALLARHSEERLRDEPKERKEKRYMALFYDDFVCNHT